MNHTPERLRCSVCDMPTVGDTLCSLHYEEENNKMDHTPGPLQAYKRALNLALSPTRRLRHCAACDHVSTV